jgi:hypothetical protein
MKNAFIAYLYAFFAAGFCFLSQLEILLLILAGMLRRRNRQLWQCQEGRTVKRPLCNAGVRRWHCEIKYSLLALGPVNNQCASANARQALFA